MTVSLEPWEYRRMDTASQEEISGLVSVYCINPQEVDACERDEKAEHRTTQNDAMPERGHEEYLGLWSRSHEAILAH